MLKQRDEGVTRLYVQLLLNDHDPDIDPWCWGGEPILRDGEYCGQTTTTGYGMILFFFTTMPILVHHLYAFVLAL